MAERPTPFGLVFGALAAERFPALADSLRVTGADAGSRDAFVLDRAVVELLRDLVPDEHDPAQISDFVATLHHAFLFWRDGEQIASISRERTLPLLESGPPPLRPPGHATTGPSVYYQFPERLIWAELSPGSPHEPLDGIFVHPTGGEAVTVLGVFGVHPGRPGFSVAEVAGTRPRGLARGDGSALFAPILPGGDSAGLHSIVGAEELLELAWRARMEAA
ncbi:MAG: hypothetical protein ACHQXA_03805 [Gemmatimonadales bacterium]